MTINSGWVKLLKEHAPEAFTDALPHKPDVVFVDGQIKLMKGEYITTWDGFLRAQFVGTIEHAFTLGATCVVMAFDDYAHVPRSKNMTQSKRNRSVPAVKFGECDELPPRPPADWNAAMRNRTFKVKVISFVMNSLRHHYKTEDRRSVVLDFCGKPEVICGRYELPKMFQNYSEQAALCPKRFQRGECDIKATNWLPASGTLLLVSTDGDFVPIALIQLEKHLRVQGNTANILIHRIKTKLKDTGKRPRLGSQKREYEYVDVKKLLGYITTEFPKSENPALFLGCMVAMTGCDFCMNLPGIGPSKIWTARHRFRNSQMNTSTEIMTALLLVYNDTYRQRTRGVTAELSQGFEDTQDARLAYVKLYEQIRKCPSIAARTKASVWDTDRMMAHVCNTMWTIQYWELLHEYADPMTGNFGYVLQNNLVKFAGQLESKASK